VGSTGLGARSAVYSVCCVYRQHSGLTELNSRLVESLQLYHSLMQDRPTYSQHAATAGHNMPTYVSLSQVLALRRTRAWVQIAAATLSGNSSRANCSHLSCLCSPGSEIGLQSWRKVTATYCRVRDLRHVQADCQEPGSAAEPYARQSIWATLFIL